VIITCERCDTEFQLDDGRVPMSGARVRCSRCKHAFFVLPPAASLDQGIEQAASAALAGDPTPEVTEDLHEVHAAEPPISGEGDDSESDWQFNGDLPADPGDSSPDLHVSGFAPASDPARDVLGESGSEDDSGPGLELASEPEPPPSRDEPREERRASETTEPSADLGSPVDWDFFNKPAERAAPAAAAAPRRASAPVLSIDVDATPEPEPRRRSPVALRYAVDAAGWIAVAALCAVALVRGLAPPAPVATSWAAPAPGLALENVRGRWLDNASLGRLYVVSGRVENRTPDAAALPPLALELRDASGRALGDPIPLRGAVPPGALREADAAALATAGSDLPGGLAPGVGWDFEVVAWPLPAKAERFAIRTRS
jgi:predicted Zn finger-like uncharacterized protein